MSNKIMSEARYRAHILETAKILKCETEVRQIFAEIDGLLKNCTNPNEQQAIAVYGIEKLHMFLSSQPGTMRVGDKIIGKE